MRTLLKAIVLVPIAAVLLAFAVANRQVVSVSFDPFSPEAPAFAIVAPLFLLVFILLMVGVLVGGAASWLSQGRHRRAARRAQAEADEARDEIERLRTELAIQSRELRDQTTAARQPVALPSFAIHDA